MIEAEGLNEDANEVYMLIDYVGDTARFVVDGEVMTDSFYTGQIWEIGLKRYCMTGLKARIDVTALHETDKESMYLQTWPEMKGGRACDINAISLLTQYRVAIN